METAELQPKTFIRVWQQSDTPDEAAKKLSQSKEKLIALASIFRQKGIELKRMRKGRVALDVSELAELAKKYAPKKN